jgi:hypothetical protein
LIQDQAIRSLRILALQIVRGDFFDNTNQNRKGSGRANMWPVSLLDLLEPNEMTGPTGDAHQASECRHGQQAFSPEQRERRRASWPAPSLMVRERDTGQSRLVNRPRLSGLPGIAVFVNRRAQSTRIIAPECGDHDTARLLSCTRRR